MKDRAGTAGSLLSAKLTTIGFLKTGQSLVIASIGGNAITVALTC